MPDAPAPAALIPSTRPEPTTDRFLRNEITSP